MCVVAINQRRNTRNGRNREPTTSPNQRPRIEFVPKLKCVLSTRTTDGVLVVSARKCGSSTEAERAVKKTKKIGDPNQKGFACFFTSQNYQHLAA